jgi:hypothetical protein
MIQHKTVYNNNFNKYWTANNLYPLEVKLNVLDGSTRIRHKMYNNLFNGEI